MYIEKSLLNVAYLGALTSQPQPQLQVWQHKESSWSWQMEQSDEAKSKRKKVIWSNKNRIINELFRITFERQSYKLKELIWNTIKFRWLSTSFRHFLSTKKFSVISGFSNQCCSMWFSIGDIQVEYGKLVFLDNIMYDLVLNLAVICLEINKLRWCKFIFTTFRHNNPHDLHHKNITQNR